MNLFAASRLMLWIWYIGKPKKAKSEEKMWHTDRYNKDTKKKLFR